MTLHILLHVWFVLAAIGVVVAAISDVQEPAGPRRLLLFALALIWPLLAVPFALYVLVTYVGMRIESRRR